MKPERHIIESAKLTLRGTMLAAGLLVLAGCGHSEPPRDESVSTPSVSAEELAAEASAFAGRDVADLMTDEDALAVGRRLFVARCGSCHDPEGGGGRNVPDLARGVLDYGETAQAIRATIAQGRVSAMPDMGSGLGEVDLGQLVAFVQSLAFEAPLSSYAERGEMLFEANCAKCHGLDGRGNSELGASNLADAYWQHGESMMNIRLVITRGVQSECPGDGDAAPAAAVDLLTAFVLGLRNSAPR